MNKKRPSLGGNAQRTDVTKMAANAVNNMNQLDEFMGKDVRDMIFISAKEIKKTFNARFIPCSLEEFSEIDWPGLELSIDEARDLYPTLLSGRPFFAELSLVQQEDFFNFLMSVHATAQSILNETQVQPITLERESADSDDLYLVDGERRTLSVLYSKGKIPLIRATVFNRRLTDLERAKIKDLANWSVSLNVHETILSKLAIYSATPDANKLSIRELGKLLGYKKTQASIIKPLFDHAHRDQIIERVKLERLGWRQIKLLLDNPGVDLSLYEKETPVAGPFWDETKLEEVKHEVVPEQKKTPKKVKDSNVIGLEERLSQIIGFQCKIDYSVDSRKVRLSLVSTMEQFEDMLSSLKRIDASKALENFKKDID